MLVVTLRSDMWPAVLLSLLTTRLPAAVHIWRSYQIGGVQQAIMWEGGTAGQHDGLRLTDNLEQLSRGQHNSSLWDGVTLCHSSPGQPNWTG